MTKRYDYIIIGAGSAGCVLANRLSEDAGTSVLVLEFGGSDRSVLIQMPSAFSLPMNTKNTTGATRPWPSRTSTTGACTAHGARCWAVRRRSTAWCTSVAMPVTSMSGKAWARKTGATAIACRISNGPSNTNSVVTTTGWAGPLSTNNGNNMQNPLYGAWVEAGAEAGYIKTDDCNGYMQEGFGAMHMTVKDGVRWSTANAYLRPAMSRPNLTVITHAMTRRILLEGKRAVGVEYDQGGQTHKVMCNREVLVASGPIGSPHLLQRPASARLRC